MDNIVLYYTSSTGCTSRSLLLKAIEKHYGISEDKLELVHEYGRKPYFASHPYIHFSISHSGDIWGVVFSDKEVGLDIQYPNPSVVQEKIAKRYFHPDEYKAFLDGEDFYYIWTRKEAVCKLFGYGIDTRFSKINTYAQEFESSTFAVKTVMPISDNFPYYSIASGADFVYNSIKF